MGQRRWTSLIAKEIKSRFLSLEFPNFTYFINCDLFTGHDAVTSYFVCEIFSLCKRIYSWQELRPNYESVLSVKCTPFQGISHFSFFSLHGGLQHKTIRIYRFPFCAKALYKITFSRHSLYSFILLYTHKRNILYLSLTSPPRFHHLTLTELFLCCRNYINICNYRCLPFCCQLSSNLRTTPTVLSAWDNYITMNCRAQSYSKCVHILPILRQHNDWSTCGRWKI